jgi:hypothetical protein
MFTATEKARRPYRHVHEVAELRELGDLVVLCLELLPVQTGGEPAEYDVFPPAQLALEADTEGKQGAHPPVDLNSPLGRGKDAGDGAQEGRLARAVDPDNA